MPTSAQPANPLTTAQDRFIATWGQMGSAWGISRTMAEVHALLFITAEALCTDDVMDRLHISRGNASMSLRALEDWGIVRRVHRRGDRKEYFESEPDVGAMFKTIARERKKREIDPLVHSLYEVRDLTTSTPKSADPDLIARHNQRLDDMLRFMEQLDGLAQLVLKQNGKGLRATLSAIGKLV